MPPTSWVDDPTIDDEAVLWRRINPADIIADSTTAAVRVSTGAFHTTEMSVHIASETTIEIVLADHPGYRLAAFTAASARRAGCIVVRDPLPDDPSHALVCHIDHTRSLSKSQAKRIAGASRLVV